VRDLIEFRAFITPTLTVFVWVLGAIVISIAGLLVAIAPSSRGGGFLPGLAVIGIGNLVWREMMEATIVLFGIHHSLRSIERSAGKSPSPGAWSKVCPDCAEEVQVRAKVCHFCRYQFPPPPKWAAGEALVPGGPSSES
jgi:hypothetical protein